MKPDKETLDSNGCNSQTKEAGAVSNSRVPLALNNQKAANSTDFCSNAGSSICMMTQDIASKSVDDSFSSTQCYTPNSKAHLRGKISSMMKKISCTKNEPLVGQITQQLRASGNRMQSSGDNTLTQRQRDLRNFIAKQRNRRVAEEEKENCTEQEEMKRCKTPQTLPAPRLLDSGDSTDLLKLITIGVTEDMKETHDGRERRQFQKSLVGTNILCQSHSHNTDVNIGDLSENDESSSIILGRKSHAPAIKGYDVSSLPILYLDNIQQSLWLDFGDERSNMVGSSRSLQFQLQAPQSLNESSSSSSSSTSSSSSSSVYVDCRFLKVERFPVGKGLTLNILDPCEGKEEEESSDPGLFSIDSGKSRKLMLTWQPMESGGMHEIIYLKLQGGQIRIIAHGKARTVKKRKIIKARDKVLNDEVIQIQEQHVAIREDSSTFSKTNKNLSLGFDSYLNKANLPKTIIKKSTSPTQSAKSSLQRRITRTQSPPATSFKPNTFPNKVKSTSPTQSAKSSLQRRITRTRSLLATSSKPNTFPNKVIISSSTKGSTSMRSMDNDTFVDKQCNTYKEYLNFLFQHKDAMRETDAMLELDIVRPRERQTLRTLLLQRQGAHVRQMAINFYRGPKMLPIRNSIALDVDNKRMFIRTDPYVLANVNLRSRLVSLLLSYSIPWLRLGLETIFGEVITANLSSKPVGSESETQGLSGMKRRGPKKTTTKALLKKIIIERVLSDPDAKMKYSRGKCMMPSGKFEVMYKEELGRNVLKRILLLVVFLDHAKMEGIINPSPCLFDKNGMAKSSKSLLAILCKDYIHGIGNLSKHLALIGISLSYTQSHMEELDFSISNIAMDLRDGTRLAKLAEILGGDSKSSILKKLRLPAVSRLQKVHNIRTALLALSNLSISNSIEFVEPDHILDDHRPQVLQFLWSIISHFNLSNLLDTVKLKEGIAAVHSANNRTSSEYKKNRNDIQNGDDEETDGLCNLLLQWCRAVCWSYGIVVSDFSKSFSDGKVLCCLVNFYHPSILRRDDILPTSLDMFHCGMNVDTIKNDPHLQEQYRQVLENERHNWTLAKSSMKEIGGIPHILPILDSTAIPDERSTIISIAYLCSRLLESTAEILSITIIQRAFRKYQHKNFLN